MTLRPGGPWAQWLAKVCLMQQKATRAITQNDLNWVTLLYMCRNIGKMMVVVNLNCIGAFLKVVVTSVAGFLCPNICVSELYIHISDKESEICNC